jgi:hypothetical protein
MFNNELIDVCQIWVKATMSLADTDLRIMICAS